MVGKIKKIYDLKNLDKANLIHVMLNFFVVFVFLLKKKIYFF